jgi:DNA-binding NarL/FixJ family response regulator
MKELTNPPQDPEWSGILEKTNEVLQELGFKPVSKLPRDSDAFNALKGKRVVMVDDSKGLVESYIPWLVVSTGGTASAILHTDQSVEALVAAVVERAPDVVLMDFNLKMEIKGTAVMEALRKSGFTGHVVGFSSDPGTALSFEKAGAAVSILKNFRPRLEMEALAEVVQILQEK